MWHLRFICNLIIIGGYMTHLDFHVFRRGLKMFTWDFSLSPSLSLLYKCCLTKQQKTWRERQKQIYVVIDNNQINRQQNLDHHIPNDSTWSPQILIGYNSWLTVDWISIKRHCYMSDEQVQQIWIMVCLTTYVLCNQPGLLTSLMNQQESWAWMLCCGV